MDIQSFISKYHNHPVLFVGTGLSLRYLKNSYSWDNLLQKIAFDLSGKEEYYLDIKHKCHKGDNQYDYLQIAKIIEDKFNTQLEEDRNGKFKEINDIFYNKMKEGVSLSRFKIYISEIFSKLEYREELSDELKEFKKVAKNISSVITTNYDGLIEDVFEFNKLIGNDILLSNPYGSVYKIHGCFSDPKNIIITDKDYQAFDNKYELIRAQLLSLFIHNPIIFIGYSINDDNIQKILKTIFTYVSPNSEEAIRIKNNFLLVEYEKGSDNENIGEHDIVWDNQTIRINKIKTDSFSKIYKAISNLQLGVTALDIRKVQNVVKEIYTGGKIKVSITEDLDSLKNGEKILAIGSTKTIQYQFQNVAEMLGDYFNIIEESNAQILELIDKYVIQPSQYFPMFGFSKINENIESAKRLKSQQENNLETYTDNLQESCKKEFYTIDSIIEDTDIPSSYKMNCIIWNAYKGNITLDEVEKYLKEEMLPNVDTNYRKLLSVYDLRKYKE